MRALVVALFALACWWPTRELPWARMDSPNFHLIAEALAKLPLADHPRAALDVTPVLGPVYAGVLNPVIWLAYEACAVTVGFDVRVHRGLRLLAFVLLAWWVMGAATRVTKSRAFGLAAALGFLAFPSHLECWTLLPVYEPIQVLCLAGAATCWWTWALPRRSPAWLLGGLFFAALAVWSKSTSWCLMLPVAVFSGWVWTAARGRERRRLVGGLVFVWVAMGLLLVGYVKAGGGQRKPGAWVSNYRVDRHEMTVVLRYDLEELWRATAVLVPLAAAGLFMRTPRWRSRRALALAVCAGWACGAFLIFLPWTAPSSRYWLLGSAPFAVVVAAGIHALWRARFAWPMRILVVGCLAWMLFQFAFRRAVLVALESARDGSVASVVECIARRAPPGATVAHVCPATGGHDLFRCVAAHLATFGGRPDLKFACTALPGPAGAAAVTVVTPRELGVVVDGAPALELAARPWHREAPDPRYALWCLRTGQPLGGPGWREDWRWRVYVTPSSPPASPAPR